MGYRALEYILIWKRLSGGWQQGTLDWMIVNEIDFGFSFYFKRVFLQYIDKYRTGQDKCQIGGGLTAGSPSVHEDGASESRC